MIPVTQTNNSPDEGDCFPACIASILEMPLEAIPNPREAQVFEMSKWLNERGILLYSPSRKPTVYFESFWIGIVPSINNEGRFHAVVMEKGDLAWDPNCGTKIKSVNLTDCRNAYFLVINDVRKMRMWLEGNGVQHG